MLAEREEILFPLFLPPPVLSELDEPDHFVGAHSPHWAGGIHRPHDHATTSDQEFGRLHIAAPVVGPPRSDGIGVGLGSPVCHGKRQALALHFLGVFLIVYTDRVD